MQGGELINSGSDTCIFSPPVKCQDSNETFDENLYVSRTVLNENEIQMQEIISKKAKQLHVEKNFIFAEKVCLAKLSPEELKVCPYNKYNLITHRFKNTVAEIFESNKQFSFEVLTDFLKVLPQFNTYGIIINDLHLRNIAYESDRMKAFDFGKSYIIQENNMEEIFTKWVQFTVISYNTIMYNISYAMYYPQSVLTNYYILHLLGWTEQNHPSAYVSVKGLLSKDKLYRLLVVFDILQVISSLIYQLASTLSKDEKQFLYELYQTIEVKMDNIQYKSFESSRNEVLETIRMAIENYSRVRKIADINMYIQRPRVIRRSTRRTPRKSTRRTTRTRRTRTKRYRRRTSSKKNK